MCSHRSCPQVPLFADCEEGFLSALALRMRMISLSPKEVIFRVGDAGKEMYVIKKGERASERAPQKLSLHSFMATV